MKSKKIVAVLLAVTMVFTVLSQPLKATNLDEEVFLNLLQIEQYGRERLIQFNHLTKELLNLSGEVHDILARKELIQEGFIYAPNFEFEMLDSWGWHSQRIGIQSYYMILATEEIELQKLYTREAEILSALENMGARIVCPDNYEMIAELNEMIVEAHAYSNPYGISALSSPPNANRIAHIYHVATMDFPVVYNGRVYEARTIFVADRALRNQTPHPQSSLRNLQYYTMLNSNSWMSAVAFAVNVTVGVVVAFTPSVFMRTLVATALSSFVSGPVNTWANSRSVRNHGGVVHTTRVNAVSGINYYWVRVSQPNVTWRFAGSDGIFRLSKMDIYRFQSRQYDSFGDPIAWTQQEHMYIGTARYMTYSTAAYIFDMIRDFLDRLYSGSMALPIHHRFGFVRVERNNTVIGLFDPVYIAEPWFW